MSKTLLTNDSKNRTEDDLKKSFVAAQTGDAEAYAWLFDHRMRSKILPSLKKRYYYLSFSDWEDLYQDVFMISWPKLSRVEEYDQLDGWLWGIANVRIFMKFTKDKKEREKVSQKYANSGVLLDTSEKSFYRIDAENEHKILIEYLLKAIESLPADDRILVEGHCFGSLTYKELALAGGIASDTVKYRLKRIKRQLRRQIEKENFGMPAPCALLLDQLFRSFGSMSSPSLEAAAGGGAVLRFSAFLKSFVGVFGVIPMSILWLTSVFLIGSKGLFHLADSVRHTKDRLWATRKLFCGYCGLILFPMILFVLMQHLPPLLPGDWAESERNAFCAWSILGAGVLSFVFYALGIRFGYRKRYNCASQKSLTQIELASQKRALSRFIHVGSILLGVAVLGFCLYYLLGLYAWPRYSLAFLLKHNGIPITLGLLCMGGFHLYCWRSFRKALFTMEKNFSASYLSTCQKRSVYFITFACVLFTLYITLVKVILSNHSLTNITVFTLYAAAWSVLICWNRKRRRLVPVFVLLVLMLLGLFLPSWLHPADSSNPLAVDSSYNRVCDIEYRDFLPGLYYPTFSGSSTIPISLNDNPSLLASSSKPIPTLRAHNRCLPVGKINNGLNT